MLENLQAKKNFIDHLTTINISWLGVNPIPEGFAEDGQGFLLTYGTSVTKYEEGYIKKEGYEYYLTFYKRDSSSVESFMLYKDIKMVPGNQT